MTMNLINTNDALDLHHEPYSEPVRFDFVTHVLGFKNYVTVAWDNPEETPLDLDMQTAALLSQVHGALKPENQAKMVEFCNAEKWRFCYLVEKAWQDLSGRDSVPA